MLKKLLNQVATVLEQVSSSEDPYGNEVIDFATVGDFRCRLDAQPGAENQVDRDTRTTYFHITLEESAAGQINALSHVAIDDKTYEVIGEPVVQHLRVVVSHVEATLRVIEG